MQNYYLIKSIRSEQALKAEKEARRYTYQYKKLIESVPALKAINKKASKHRYFF